MKAWKEFLKEQAFAANGNWDIDGGVLLDDMALGGLTRYNIKQKAFATLNGNVLDLYLHKHKAEYMIGYVYSYSETNKSGVETITRFKKIAFLTLSRDKSVQQKFRHKKVYNVDLVFVDDDYRRAGLTKTLYGGRGYIRRQNTIFWCKETME